MSAGLPVYPVAALDGMDLGEALVRADNDHRLDRPACLLIRSESRHWRTVQAVTAEGLEVEIPVRPASASPSLRNPFGQAPTDTVTGPLGPGPVTYLPATRGLRVLAFAREEQD